jgi:hypothetical protein
VKRAGPLMRRRDGGQKRDRRASRRGGELPPVALRIRPRRRTHAHLVALARQPSRAAEAVLLRSPRRHLRGALSQASASSISGATAGFWSLAAVEAGAAYVLGVDARQMHIDQANLVFRAKGVDPGRFAFRTGNVFDLDLSAEEGFDVVLCLGLLYHVSKPFELMERIAAWNTDLLVIDTAVDPSPAAIFRFREQNLDDPRSAADLGAALLPSRRAVARLAETFGYESVVVLRPRFTSWMGSRDYRLGKRRAFMCSKPPNFCAASIPTLCAGRDVRPSTRVGLRALLGDGSSGGQPH